MPTRAAAMELNIPGIHGVGDSLIYFVDRYRDFSIYDVDFVPLPGHRSAAAGAGRAALVRRGADDPRRAHAPTGSTSTRRCFGFSVLPQGQYFGVLPKGTLLESPCHKFYLQLIEPPPGSEEVALGRGAGARGPRRAATCPPRCARCSERGIVFVDRGAVQPSDKGALTQLYLGGVTFELVVSHLSREPRPLRHGHDHPRGAARGQAARDPRGRASPR